MIQRLAVICGLLFGLIALAPTFCTASERDFRDCRDCPRMTMIPTGSFAMGSPSNEAGHAANESPQHQVTIAHRFAIGIYDVTRAEYAAFVRAAHYKNGDGCYGRDGPQMKKFPARGWRNPGFAQTNRDPVVCVSWDDAKAYVAWLNTRIHTHQNLYRLPTEAEWEYAARAGTTTPYIWGHLASHEHANTGADNGPPFEPFSRGRDRWDYTGPGGSFAANKFGLFDMAGNAAQWVEDCRHDFSEDYAGAPVDGSAWYKGDCKVRTLRGSSWDASPPFVRVAARAGTPPDFRLWHVGFRVAKTLD